MATTDREELTGGAGEWRRRYEATPEREGELFSVLAVPDTNPLAAVYLNRHSDLLFVLARSANAEAGVEGPLWRPGSTP